MNLPSTTIADPMSLCRAVAASGLGGAKTPESAFTLACMALAEDPTASQNPLAFMAALGRATTNYHIVNGRPTMKAEICLARFQQAGGKVEWHSYTDTECKATFSHPAGGSVTLDWTIARAKAAGLTGKPGPWQSHPRAMLRSRVIVEAIRTIYPAVLNGTMEPDEAMEASAPAVSYQQAPEVVGLTAKAKAAFVRIASKNKAKAEELKQQCGGSPQKFLDLVAEYENPVPPTEPTPINEASEPVVIIDESNTP